MFDKLKNIVYAYIILVMIKHKVKKIKKREGK